MSETIANPNFLMRKQQIIKYVLNDQTYIQGYDYDDSPPNPYTLIPQGAIILDINLVTIQDDSCNFPNYQGFLDSLDLEILGGNGLYSKLIRDNRYAIDPISNQQLALTIANQAEAFFIICRDAINNNLNEKDIRNLSWRVNSIIPLLDNNDKEKLRNAILENNIPITI